MNIQNLISSQFFARSSTSYTALVSKTLTYCKDASTLVWPCICASAHEPYSIAYIWNREFEEIQWARRAFNDHGRQASEEIVLSEDQWDLDTSFPIQADMGGDPSLVPFGSITDM
jgi:hypothetical protein